VFGQCHVGVRDLVRLGYIAEQAEAAGMRVMIPLKKNRKVQRPMTNITTNDDIGWKMSSCI
jgi:hypothetical protein